MVTNHDEIDFRARAYHDHGHENNSKLPRWEDSRHGSGFNYRMTELQAAVGLAQLKKLDYVIEGQREWSKKLSEVIGSFKQLKIRPMPATSEPSCDAMVFYAPSKEDALKCRSALLQNGLGTKILPEAVTWHFARTWTHIPTLVDRMGGDLSKVLSTSQAYLDRCVSLPINLKMADDTCTKVDLSLRSVFG